MDIPGVGADGAAYVLLTDVPATEGPDPLGLDVVARGLARSLLASRASTPLTLGIEGEWGSGKSSLMRRLKTELDRDSDITTVWFNAWTAERASALEGLIKTVLDTLDPSILRRSLRSQQMLSVGRAVLLVVGGWFGWNRVADAAWKRVSVDARARNELRSLVEKAIAQWRDRRQAVPNGRTLVVFIDDLDRASPDQVFEIFEALKVYLDVPGLVFVVGFDRGVLERVAVDRGGVAFLAKEYLEKIVQASYRIPPLDERQAQGLLDVYTGLSGTTGLFDETSRAMMVEHNQRNPRRVKRFLNAFVLMYSLEPEWSSVGAKQLVDVLLLETNFAEFAALFASGDADPIAEFMEYWAAKRRLVAPGSPVDDVDEAIRSLELRLPELYPLLFENEAFVALARSMHASPQWPEARARIRRSGTFGAILPPSDAAAELALPGAPTAREASLLWLSDRPDADRAVVRVLQDDGWIVTEAREAAVASRLLSSRPFDLLVSDAERDGNPNAGFDDLEVFRRNGLHDGPVVFFVLRLTPERRERAQALGAQITNRVDDLLLLARSRPAPAVEAAQR